MIKVLLEVVLGGPLPLVEEGEPVFVRVCVCV